MKFFTLTALSAALMAVEAAPHKDMTPRGTLGLENLQWSQSQFVCGGKHTPDKDGCAKLLDELQNDRGEETIPLMPRSECNYGCCVSWSEPLYIKWGQFIPFFRILQDSCAQYGKSGEVPAGESIHLCLSDRASGCGPLMKLDETEDKQVESGVFTKRAEGVFGWCNVARDGKHAPNKQDCEALVSSYENNRDTLPRKPREDCHGDCCVSWSSEVNGLPKGEVYPYIREVLDQIHDGESGRSVCRDDFFSFCLSNRGKGCKATSPKGTGELVAEGAIEGFKNWLDNFDPSAISFE
ncbi:hypothetical protein DICA0_C07074 [Diutina catenulata]